jgi:light-regulated signal transduction histidine kinase (bacteriophytochrome)
MILPSDTGTLNNSDCELIYAPGSIQPHGILLVLESPVLKILQVSNNTFEALGIYPEELLGKFLQEFVETEKLRLLKKLYLKKVITLTVSDYHSKVKTASLFLRGRCINLVQH